MARFYTRANRHFYRSPGRGRRSQQPREARERGLRVEPAGREQPEEARRVPDVRAGHGGRQAAGQDLGQRRVVRLGVGTEGAAGAEELDAQLLVALEVLRLEARALRGEAVGPAEDGELLPERPGRPDETVGPVVGAGVF